MVCPLISDDGFSMLTSLPSAVVQAGQDLLSVHLVPLARRRTNITANVSNSLGLSGWQLLYIIHITSIPLKDIHIVYYIQTPEFHYNDAENPSAIK